jgi:hypothetical protein
VHLEERHVIVVPEEGQSLHIAVEGRASLPYCVVDSYDTGLGGRLSPCRIIGYVLDCDRAADGGILGTS